MSPMREENADERRDTFGIKESSLQTIDGQVLQVSGSTLLMTNNDGQKLFYTIAADANLTCDGQACKAGDLKPGTRIRVTNNKSLNMATSVETMDTGSSTPNEMKGNV